MSDPTVLIVMPAFNEEASVAAVIAETRVAMPQAEILVVDDGSRDSTAAEALSAGAKVARLPFNLGVGAAMRVGYRYAVEHGFDVTVQIDSDGQHDPHAVPALIDALAGADVVLGARFAGEGDYSVRGPRRWAMQVLAGILSRVCRTRLTDTTSGFRAVNGRAAKIWADHYPAEYLGDTIEALVIAQRAGLRVRQVPVAMRERAAGVPSHSPWRAAVYLSRAAVALVFALVRPSASYGRAAE